MSKTNNTTTKRKFVRKKGSKITASDNRPQDTKNPYLQWGSWRVVPMTKAGAERLAEELVTWVLSNENVLCIEDFLVRHRVNSKTYYQWLHKFEILSDANDFAVMTLSARRETGGLRKELDSNLVKFSLPYYNGKYKELVEWYTSLKNPEEAIAAASKIIVQMSKFPESDLVPSKPKE